MDIYKGVNLKNKPFSQLVFWGAGTARTLRPIWVAEELGLSYSLNPIGPRTGETQTPQYSKLNPKQKVPFCEDGDLKLSESVAICRYLVNRYDSDAKLKVPDSIEAQAKEDEWLSFIFGELDETSLYVMRRHGALAKIYGDAPSAIAAARDYVVRQFKVIELHMKDRRYLLNEKFSLPDIFLITCLNWAEDYGIPLSKELEEYRDNLTQRDAYKKAVERNQKS